VRRDLESRAPGAVLLAQRADVDRAADLARLRRDDDVPRELQALVPGTPLPARSLAFAAGRLQTRAATAPDRPRGPPPSA
jgi:hypothetical protein